MFAANLDTHAVRQIANVRGTTLNCDETFSVTTLNAVDPTGRVQPPPPRVMLPQRERMFGDKLKAGLPLTPDEEYAATKEDGLSARIPNQGSMAFTFTDLKTGAALTTGYQYAWLNHLQFSPTDPNLLLYCHEGTWHEVDRVWVIRTDEHRPAAAARPHDGHGDRRPRVLEPRRLDGVVRPAASAQP